MKKAAFFQIAAALIASCGFGHAATLLVLNKGGSLAIIDAASEKILARVPTGEQPHEVVATADGRLAVVSNWGPANKAGHTLSVIDLASRKELHRVELAPLTHPHGLFAADGKVYFTAEGAETIARYDPATNRVDWKLRTGQIGTHMILLSKDRNTIFTTNTGSATISIFMRDGEDWRPTVVKIGRGAEGFDLSPDGAQLWAANAHDRSVSILDVAAKKVIETFPLASKRANRLKFTPDGRRVLISDLDTGDLIVLDRASHRLIKRLNLGRGSAGVLIAPDGSRAFVAETPDDYVSVVDLATINPIGRIATGHRPDGLAWVP